MKWNGKSGFALFLIGCGVLIVLNKIGLGFGNLFGLLIPLGMLVLGYIGIKHGKKVIGTILIVLGAIFLLGKLSGLIGLIIAIALIYYGVSVLKKRSNAY